MSSNQDAASNQSKAQQSAAGAAANSASTGQTGSSQQQQKMNPSGNGPFHPSSGPADPIKLGADVPCVGIDRARALRKAWLTQTRQLPPQRPEPDFDELEEAFDDEVPFEPPVHLPNLLLLLLDIWDEEGLLQ
jgi:hypothetical protein